MTKCVFCGREERYFKGTHVMKNNGTIAYYCSSKCRKNAEKLGRDKRKVRWTEAFHITRDKGIARELENKEKAAAKEKAKSEPTVSKKKASK